MSSEYVEYNAFIASWHDATDSQIKEMIDEMNYLLKLGNYEYKSAVESVINGLVSEADKAETLAITADAAQIAADAAAIGSIFSFGLGMAAFAGLEAAALVDKQLFTSASKDLQKHVDKADETMASKMSPTVSAYVKAFKDNNNTFLKLAPKGMSSREMRSAMLQFMLNATLYYSKKGEELTIARFKTIVESARRFSSSNEYKEILKTLDSIKLAKNDQTKKEDLKQLISQMRSPASEYSTTLECSTLGIMGILSGKLKISEDMLTTVAKEAGVLEEFSMSEVFLGLELSGKAFAAFGFILAIADIVISIVDIVKVVDQMKKFKSSLKGEVKDHYISYFKGIKDLATKYNEFEKAIKK